MADCIEREKIISELESYLANIDNLCDDPYYSTGVNEGLTEAISVIKDAPAADVHFERHGMWVQVSDDDQDEGWYFCSKCKEEFFNQAGNEEEMLPKFCPNCGAKMDKKGGGDND